MGSASHAQQTSDAVGDAVEGDPQGATDVGGLASDTPKDPSSRLFSSTPPAQTRFHTGYLEEEFAIQKLDPTLTNTMTARMASTVADGVFSVDARLAAVNSGQWAYVACRADGTGRPSGYYLGVHPFDGAFTFGRWTGADTASAKPFVQREYSAAVQSGTAINHLELSCNGPQIAAAINGWEVARISDDYHSDGRPLLAAATDRGLADVRFTNFAIRQAQPLADTPPPVPSRAPGTRIVSDDMADVSSTLFPTSRTTEARFVTGYVDGEYAAQKLDPGYKALATGSTLTRFPDGVFSVDVRPMGQNPDQWAYIACRNRPGRFGAYYLGINPGAGAFTFGRWDNVDPNGVKLFVARTFSPAIQTGGAVNRIQLTCSGAQIQAAVNGWEVGRVSDDWYSDGQALLAVGSDRGTADIRFSKFAIEQAGPLPDQVAAPPSTPGRVILRDAFENSHATWITTRDTPPVTVQVENGELAFHRIERSVNNWFMPVAVPIGDVTVEVDTRIGTHASGNQEAGVGCRTSVTDGRGYTFYVFPELRVFHLLRRDGGTPINLVPSASANVPVLPAPMLQPGQPAHMRLDCVGETITGYLNGAQVFSVKDSTHTSGSVVLWAETTSSSDGLDVRFKNLVLMET